MNTQKDLDTDLDLEIDEPRAMNVFLLNDDYTSMEFVTNILITLFRKSHEEAETIMLNIHEKGKGLCGVYTPEIAETKIDQVHSKAKENGFPLRATMEEA
jgi:ATP-dependent Clp protease adaptor protein ClpS